MFDLGWTELMVIGIVALIVVGPKDLPGLFRTVGSFVGKARGMAREFSRAMEEAADESGVGDISNSIKAASNPAKFGMDKVKEATDFKHWMPDIDTGLSEDRASDAKKIHDATAAKAEARQTADTDAAPAENAPAPDTAQEESPKDKA